MLMMHIQETTILSCAYTPSVVFKEDDILIEEGCHYRWHVAPAVYLSLI